MMRQKHQTSFDFCVMRRTSTRVDARQRVLTCVDVCWRASTRVDARQRALCEWAL